jgi:HD-GYP domain-containing protein (c-di-GMP phosphodiesterase class II)
MKMEELSIPIQIRYNENTDSYVRNPVHKTDVLAQSDFKNKEEFEKEIKIRLEQIRNNKYNKLLELRTSLDGWSIYGLIAYIDYIEVTKEQIAYMKTNNIRLVINKMTFKSVKNEIMERSNKSCDLIRSSKSIKNLHYSFRNTLGNQIWAFIRNKVYDVVEESKI